MTVPGNVVGQTLGTSTVTITPRMTMAYAAGISADDTRYLDDLLSEGIVAPPFFCVVLEWPIVNGPLYRDLIRINEQEAWGTIHVLQDSVFHEPIRPGRTLTTTGRIIKVKRTSVGAYVASKLETHDRETGHPVVTSFFAAIVLGVEAESAERALEEPPAPRKSVSSPTAGLECVSIAIPRTMPHVYTECTAIWGPIHTERAIARSRGLPDIILHGTATWALAGQTIIRRMASGNPLRLKRLSGHFNGMVIPGSSIFVELGKDSRRPAAVEFAVRNAMGKLAIRDGYAEVLP